MSNSAVARKSRFHPAWIAAAVTFLTLVSTSGFRSAPTVLMMPLQTAFGWSRASISSAISINVLVYGLTAPFAAALMERFGIRKVVITALTIVGSGAWCTQYITQPWHLAVLWGLIVGGGTGSMALVFAASIVNRWFIKKRGIVIGVLTAASAAGNLIFLPLFSRLAMHYGWKSISITVGLSSLAMDTAANLLALVGVFDVVGTIFSGWLTDRVSPDKLGNYAAAFYTAAILCVVASYAVLKIREDVK